MYLSIEQHDLAKLGANVDMNLSTYTTVTRARAILIEYSVFQTPCQPLEAFLSQSELPVSDAHNPPSSLPPNPNPRKPSAMLIVAPLVAVLRSGATVDYNLALVVSP